MGESTKKRVLVTGAAGFVGSNLCRELVNNGYEVLALHRPTTKLDALRQINVKLIEGDITDRESLRGAFEGVQWVFHIAAVFREAKFGDDYYWKVNLEGTRNVLDIAIEKGVRRVIHCSTTGVHGHIDNPPGNEESPYSPRDVYQESKTEAEKLVISYAKDGMLDTVVVRPIMIWGPGDTRILKLFKGIAHRRMPIIGDGRTLFHWVLVTDLARGFRLAAETPGTKGEVFLIGGERPVSISETYQAISEEFGVKPLPFKIPAWPFKILGGLVEAICKPFGIEPPLHKRRVEFFTKTRAYDCSKAKDRLGYKPEHTFREEVKIIADWYKKAGWI